MTTDVAPNLLSLSNFSSYFSNRMGRMFESYESKDRHIVQWPVYWASAGHSLLPLEVLLKNFESFLQIAVLGTSW